MHGQILTSNDGQTPVIWHKGTTVGGSVAGGGGGADTPTPKFRSGMIRFNKIERGRHTIHPFYNDVIWPGSLACMNP